MVNKHLFSCLRKVIFVSLLKIQGYQNISKRIFNIVAVKRATHSRLCDLGEISFARLIRRRRRRRLSPKQCANCDANRNPINGPTKRDKPQII